MTSLRQAWRLGAPVRVCDVRPGVALADRTPFELMILLQEGGWEWRRWTGSRRLPLGYTADGDKLWFTSG
eukprot:602134-Alexandrium_andersonii.AAC.1